MASFTRCVCPTLTQLSFDKEIRYVIERLNRDAVDDEEGRDERAGS